MNARSTRFTQDEVLDLIIVRQLKTGTRWFALFRTL
ncbi:Uncharacterised protein [Vibrio cholerae]|nr:Uncharacterised protein [Vibrio cholerae]